MNWFERHSQESSLPGNTGAEAPSDGGTPGQRVVFQGNDVNQMILEGVIKIMDDIPEDVHKFLERAGNSDLGKFLLRLSSNNQYGDFKRVVESYVNDGFANMVASGSHDGYSALQDWYSQLNTYLAGDTPFAGVERDISMIAGIR